MQREVAGKNVREGGVGLAMHSEWPETTDKVKFFGFRLNWTKVGPDSALVKFWTSSSKVCMVKSRKNHAKVYNTGIF